MGLDTLRDMASGSNYDLLNAMSQMIRMMNEYFPQFASTSVMLGSWVGGDVAVNTRHQGGGSQGRGGW